MRHYTQVKPFYSFVQYYVGFDTADAMPAFMLLQHILTNKQSIEYHLSFRTNMNLIAVSKDFEVSFSLPLTNKTIVIVVRNILST